ncbi:uncharacterized [Tachysurus ichikawai]
MDTYRENTVRKRDHLEQRKKMREEREAAQSCSNPDRGEKECGWCGVSELLEKLGSPVVVLVLHFDPSLSLIMTFTDSICCPSSVQASGTWSKSM